MPGATGTGDSIPYIEQLEKKKEELKALYARAVDEKENLTFILDCDVKNVVGYTNAIKQHGVVRYGGSPLQYWTTGYQTVTEISVKINDYINQEIKDSPIEKITFDGALLPIELNDKILAYVNKGREIHIPEDGSIDLFAEENINRAMFGNQKRYHLKYVERDFKEKEATARIDKMVKGRKVASWIGKLK